MLRCYGSLGIQLIATKLFCYFLPNFFEKRQGQGVNDGGDGFSITL